MLVSARWEIIVVLLGLRMVDDISSRFVMASTVEIKNLLSIGCNIYCV